MQRGLKLFVDAFVLWVVVFSLLAWWQPAAFTGFRPWIKPGLGLIMFGMGMTLLPADFLRVARMPRAVACGVAGQFIIMPLAAWGIARVLRLEPELAMGLIIVGCCPGGTASNVVAYLARADVSLSVTMTAVSTLLAVVLTPLLTWGLGGTYMAVDPLALLLDVCTIVLVPVALGLAFNTWFRRFSVPLQQVFPAISVLVIVLIIACVVGLSHEKLPAVIGTLGAAVLLHNLAGLGLGYGLAWACRLPATARRTVAIEVGMQNSGLAVALASAHFTPLAALPGSLFSVLHNLTGATLASVWRRTDVDAPDSVAGR